jgi:predicted RNase H-like HicB family nuclease
MRYAIVIEKADSNYSAYVPDLPGCIATGVSISEVEAEIREAIVFHLEGLREDGLPVPPGASTVEYIDCAKTGCPCLPARVQWSTSRLLHKSIKTDTQGRSGLRCSNPLLATGHLLTLDLRVASQRTHPQLGQAQVSPPVLPVP